MKRIVLITLLFITAACKKETVTTRLDEMVMDTAAAKTFTGSFENLRG